MKSRSDNLIQVTKTSVEAIAPARDWRSKRDNVLKRYPDTPFLAPRVVIGLVRFAEALLVLTIALCTLALYPGISTAASQWSSYAIIILAAAVALPLLFQAGGLYRFETLLHPLRNMPIVAMAWLVLSALLSVAIFMGKIGTDISRMWFAAFAVAGVFFVASARFMIGEILRYMNRNGQLNRRAVLVGGGASAEQVIGVLENSRSSDVNLVGIFDDRHDSRSPDVTKGLHMLGSTDDLIDFVRSTRIDTLIITLPITAEDRILEILNRLWILPVDIRISAHGQKLRYRPRAYSYIGNLPLLDLFDRPLGDWGPFLKAAEDRIIATLALALLSPVFLLIALAVKLESKGPVFFKQKRYGFNNELIEVYKFRSMYTDMADADAAKLVTRGDPRVTRVGRFIRGTSLDELPQFLNVLKGDLSLVGPRPHATKASAAGNLYEQVVEGYFARHKVKPGITGWAQINGWRGETDTREKIERRVEHDLHYIENWSLTFDLYILARTPFALFNTDQAY